jgi:hypothetical protein
MVMSSEDIVVVDCAVSKLLGDIAQIGKANFLIFARRYGQCEFFSNWRFFSIFSTHGTNSH